MIIKLISDIESIWYISLFLQIVVKISILDFTGTTFIGLLVFTNTTFHPLFNALIQLLIESSNFIFLRTGN